MSKLVKCHMCNTILQVSECEEIKDKDIVTCMDEKDKVISEYCWGCNFKPANSQACLDFIKDEKKLSPFFRQFTKKELFG